MPNCPPCAVWHGGGLVTNFTGAHMEELKTFEITETATGRKAWCDDRQFADFEASGWTREVVSDDAKKPRKG